MVRKMVALCRLFLHEMRTTVLYSLYSKKIFVQDPHCSIPSRVVRAGATQTGIQAAAVARRLQGLQQQLQELEPEWCVLHHGFCQRLCNIHIAAIQMLCLAACSAETEREGKAEISAWCVARRVHKECGLHGRR